MSYLVPTPVVTLKVENARAFSEPLEQLPRAVELFIAKLSLILVKAIKAVTPIKRHQHTPPKSRNAYVKRGGERLVHSIRRIWFEKLGLRSWALVGTTKSYAGHVQFGTPAHPIQHRRAQALAIFKPSAEGADAWGFVYRKRVRHPGTKPNDFIGRGVARLDSDQQLAMEVGIAWGDSFEQAGAPIPTSVGGPTLTAERTA